MKKFFLPIFAVLLVLGSILPLAAYRVTRAVLSGAEPASSAVSSPAASAQPPSAVPSADAETFLVEDQATGQVLELSRQEYVLGAVAAEMPVSWPDEALKAQAVGRPQLCALLPGPHHPAKRRLAHCRPSPAAGLPDRAGAAQLLGHRLRAELCPPLRPCGRGLG